MVGVHKTRKVMHMVEILLGALAILGAVVGLLFKRNGTLKRKATQAEEKASSAEKVAAHNESVTNIIVERGSIQEQVIMEAVDESTKNDFSDFYANDDN